MKSLLLASVATALLTLAPGHEYEPSRCRGAAFRRHYTIQGNAQDPADQAPAT